MLAVHIENPGILRHRRGRFPRLYSYIRNLLFRSYDQAPRSCRRARGLGSRAILFRHVLPLQLRRLLALFWRVFAIAFGAAISIGALCDSPV